ncbi:MAG TPA: M20/M25/M40 family metallo-hydrolase [Longimicrobiales bacterium]
MYETGPADQPGLSLDPTQGATMNRDLSFDRAIAFARDLIRIPSAPGAEGDVAARVLRELEALGFDEVRSDAAGNIIGRVEGRGRAPAVMLSSHLDVVDVGDPASWEHPPFDAVLEGGFLHGRGAMDIKGPLALQTYAAARFLDERPDGDVLVAHTVLEERGGWGMAHLLEAEGVRPGAAILGEATGGDICIGHRGRAELLVDLHGLAGHASAPERARNPLDVLESVLPAIRAFAGRLPADPVLGRSTIAPTRVETLPRSNNVIPDLVRLTLDWRVLPGLTAERAAADLEGFLREHVRIPEGFTLEVRLAAELQETYTGRRSERPLFTPGYLLDPDHPVARAAADAVARATGRTPAVRPWTFATDGGHTCGEHGIPTIGFAPGEERHAHTNRERLELDAAREVYEAYPGVVRALQAVTVG